MYIVDTILSFYMEMMLILEFGSCVSVISCIQATSLNSVESGGVLMVDGCVIMGLAFTAWLTGRLDEVSTGIVVGI